MPAVHSLRLQRQSHLLLSNSKERISNHLKTLFLSFFSYSIKWTWIVLYPFIHIHCIMTLWKKSCQCERCPYFITTSLVPLIKALNSSRSTEAAASFLKILQCQGLRTKSAVLGLCKNVLKKHPQGLVFLVQNPPFVHFNSTVDYESF